MSMKKEHEIFITPASILLGSIIISLAIYFSPKEAANTAAAVKTAPTQLSKPRAVSASDHVLGSRSAKAFIIEYSDTECPYCKRFHTVLHDIIKNYGKDGRVAWVYRHFPLTIHPRAFKEAEAMECSAEQGGNDMFWKYTDRLFEITPSNNKLEPSELSNIAKYVGLDVDKFKICLDSGKYASKIQSDIKDGSAAGAKGTPYTVIVSSKGTFPMSGSASYITVEAKLKEALGK